jgi:hypothetical protein
VAKLAPPLTPTLVRPGRPCAEAGRARNRERRRGAASLRSICGERKEKREKTTPEGDVRGRR